MTQLFMVEHIRIVSTRSFGDVRAALESRVQALALDRVVPLMKKNGHGRGTGRMGTAGMACGPDDHVYA